MSDEARSWNWQVVFDDEMPALLEAREHRDAWAMLCEVYRVINRARGR